MKQQILVIHGGNAFNSYDEFINDLKKKQVFLDQFKTLDWKYNLQNELGDGYDVLNPKMPNFQNAKYAEWKIWFERIIPQLDKEIILIGHSLGGIFIVKYLSENKYPKKIKETILVAPPYNTRTKHPLADFILKSSLDGFNKQAGRVVLFHSKDDLVVPFTNAKDYEKEIKNLDLKIFENRGHFTQDSFPEIIEEIKLLST